MIKMTSSFLSVWQQIRRRSVAERLVRALVIVAVKIILPRRKQFEASSEVAGVDQLLERAPQALDQNIVERASAAIHTDGDAALRERSQESTEVNCEP